MADTTSTVSVTAPLPVLELTTTQYYQYFSLDNDDSSLSVEAAVGYSATVEVSNLPDDTDLSVTPISGPAISFSFTNAPGPDDLQVTATQGAVSQVSLTAPKPTLRLETGATVTLTNKPTLSVTALTGGAATVSLVASVPTLGIEGSGDQVASVSLQPAKPTLVVTAASGSVSTVELVAALPSLYITGFRVGDSVVELTAPLPELEVTGLFGSSSTIVLIAPEPELLVWPDLDSALAGVFAAYVMSMETTKVSTYSNFPFKALVYHGGAHLGVAADGIYELTGSDDAGSQINATIKFGYDDMGSDQFKRVPHVYVGCKADGDLQFLVSVDGAPEQATQFSPELEGIHNTKVKPGRGHRGRYWRPGLVNVAGCDFEVASMSLVEELLKRRVS